MISARNMSRHLLALLVAGLWALAIAWTPETSQLSEDRVVTSLGQVESGHTLPATETPNFGAPEPEEGDDRDAVVPTELAAFPPSGAEIERPTAERPPASERHDVASSARGPPIRA